MRAQMARARDGVTEFSRSMEARLDGDVEHWGQEHVDFISRAHRAIRQALYFTRFLEVDADEVLCEHIQRSVTHALNGVPAIPDPPPDRARVRADWESPQGAQAAPGQPSSAMAEDLPYTGARVDFKDLIPKWRALRTECESARDVASLRRLQEDLIAFLRASATQSWVKHLTYTRLPAVALVLRQHLGFAVGLVFAAAVFCGVEAVFSLFANRPVYGRLAFLFAVLPSIVLLLAGLKIRRHRTPFWDVGGRVARGCFPAHIEPATWIPWHPRRHPLTRRVFLGLLYKIGLYALLWLFFWAVVQLLVTKFHWDATLMTVYLIAVMLAGLPFAGAAIDFVDAHSQAPLRGILLSGVIVIGGTVLLTDDELWLIVLPIGWAVAASLWVWRVQQARAVAALIVVIAGIVAVHSTTSSRIETARWRNSVAPVALIDLSEWPAGGDSGAPVVVMAASGGGSRAALMTAHTLERLQRDFPVIANNLQAISSVSGGSLAAAAHVVRQLRSKGLDGAGLPPCDASLVEAAGQDFLYPTLRRAIPFMGGRAEGIQRAWQECPTGLGTLQLSRLTEIWRSQNVRARGTPPPFAVPIFNSVSLDRHAVAITPLTGQFFLQRLDTFARSPQGAVHDGDADANSMWVYYRSGIYHLADLGDSINPRLTEAVRASANFPFGFPLVEVASTAPLWYSPRAEQQKAGTPKVVLLTDGGALSNSGLWPLQPLLLNKLDVLKRRGVLLIIVDASGMPSIGAADRQRGLVETILDKAPKSERAHFQMLEQLARAYEGCFAFVQVAVEPLKKNNIYTTWALDGGSRALLDTLFENSWQSISGRLEPAFASLNGCKVEKQFANARRVPVN